MTASRQPLLSRVPPFLLPLAVALVTFAAFSPALSHGWLEGWDDDHNFLWNERYRGLGGEQLNWAFTTTLHGPYQPLSWISAGLDWELHGMDATGYHLTNVLLHVVAAVLCFGVVRELLRRSGGPETGRAFAAACGALLFAVHPLRVESVAWITERRDVLSGVFYLATLRGYLAWTDETSDGGADVGRRRLAYAATVAAFAAAVLSKATGMLLPFALLLLDVFPLRRTRGPALLLDKLPLLAISAFAAWMAWRGQHDAGTFAADLPLHVRLAVAAYGLVFYPLTTLVPVGLSPLYELGRPDPSELRFVLSAAAVIGVTALVIVRRREWPAALASWGFYVVLALPVLGLFQAGSHLVADRYSYLPCLPVAVFGAWAVQRLRGPAALRLGAPLAIVAALAILTHRQTRVWSDPPTLWAHALAVDPDNSEAHLQLGVIALETERWDAAESHLARSAKLRDDQPLVWNNLGFLAGRRGDHARAAACFERAVELDPTDARARANLEAALETLGR